MDQPDKIRARGELSVSSYLGHLVSQHQAASSFRAFSQTNPSDSYFFLPSLSHGTVISWISENIFPAFAMAPVALESEPRYVTTMRHHLDTPK